MAESDIEEEYDSSDEELDEITDDDTSSTNSQLKLEELYDNPFYKVLLEQSKYPTKFLAHRIMMTRINSLTKGAMPLIDISKLGDIKSLKNYEEISNFIYRIALEEIKEHKSPVMVMDPFFNVLRPVSYYHQEPLLKILNESYRLANEEV